MGLNLNNTIVPYKEAYGRVVNTMPGLIAEGRVPANTSDVMRQRLESGLKDWKDNYFFVGDAIAYHPDGKFKIILDSQTLRKLSPESKLRNGALVLEDGAYEQLQGTEFSRQKIKQFLDKDMSAKDIKDNPIWKEISRDKSLLNAYVDTMFAEMKKRFGQNNANYDNNMGVYLENGDKMPTLRALVVGGLEVSSRLDGWGDLDDGGGRLVGVAPEALSAKGKTIVKPSLETALM